MVTPHYLKDLDVLALIPEYDEEGTFSSLVIITKAGDKKWYRIQPMINLSTEVPYLEIIDMQEIANPGKARDIM